jgi:hypothetical protein
VILSAHGLPGSELLTPRRGPREKAVVASEQEHQHRASTRRQTNW